MQPTLNMEVSNWLDEKLRVYKPNIYGPYGQLGGYKIHVE